MYYLIVLSEYIARAGGGGSGGGGGGGSGSSEGGVGGVLIMIGYIPSYILGILIKKVLPRVPELIVSTTINTIVSVFILIIGLANGGMATFYLLVIITGIWMGWYTAFFDTWSHLYEKSINIRKKLKQAKIKDSSWDDTTLESLARDTFKNYQRDWSNFNIDNMKNYLSPRYYQHAVLLMGALKELGRRNELSLVSIDKMLFIDMHDDNNNEHDYFDVAFEASIDDKLINDSGKTLFFDQQQFTEYWRFKRYGNTWKLDGITQHTQNFLNKNYSLEKFAIENNMYYSLDMGWLLIPEKSVLMKGGIFGLSDINNHIIGLYDKRLVQLYTYSDSFDSSYKNDYLIIQTTLPKSYGGIIVQPKKKLFNLSGTYLKTSSAYKDYSFEWPDFNKRFEVKATDPDRLATFELINPSFMAYLYDNDPGLGIEVVDNTLYIFVKLKANHTQDIAVSKYQIMLNILMKAFNELKM